ncbi:peptidase domain-containing ABC transporter [Aquimarina latercula]|uniref:peptidase domain-containing ABC transporter n=1 Tax=Aquimarina latercula TaxID=987 RepID=UPI00041F9545|nr:peptidase domain-containing ABC transporter [Aquimarina latercula]
MLKKKFPFYKQYDNTDCGPACLRIIAKYYGKVFSPQYLRELCHITREGVTVMGISDAAEVIGFRSLPVNVTWDSLEKEVPLPCIAHWKQRHFVVVYKVEKDKVYISDPNFGLLNYSREQFIKAWQNTKYLEKDDEGLLILLEPTPEFHSNSDVKEKQIGFKSLIPYLTNYKKYYFQLIAGLVVGSVIQIILPFLTQSIVDRGINYRDLNFIYIILIAQLTLFLSQTSVNIIRSWLLVYTGSKINIALTADFLVKLLKLPVSFFSSKISSDILQRVQDSSRIENFLSSSPNTVFSVFNMIIFSVILFYYSPIIFLIFLLGASLYLLWIFLFMKKRAEIDHKRFQESSGGSFNLLQIVDGIQEIKINNSEKRRRWDWEEQRIKLYKTSIKSLKLAQIQNNGASFFNELKNIIISYVAAVSVIEGSMTLGMMLAVQYIIGQINAPLIGLVQFFKDMQDAKISLKRINEVHGLEDENNLEISQKNIPTDDITLNKIKFQYGGIRSKVILEDVSFQIPNGKVTAVVGASGSGKTTLLKLLLKLYNPTSGTIKIGGANIENLDTKEWRSKCGVVMQDGFIFTDSIARNITESNSEGLIDKERLQRAVQIANIEGFVESLPGGYNTRIGPPGTSGVSVSGGQAQRILIARAVYKNPDILFFDEATSALDANNEKVIMENLERFFMNRTVLIIAHRLSTVKNADQIIVLDKGSVIEQGTHIELTNLRGVYYTLVKNQLELGN